LKSFPDNKVEKESKKFPEGEVKDKMLAALLFGGMSLLAVSVSLCGIGLSMGIRKLSVSSFFFSILLLVILRFVGRKAKS